MGFLTPSNLENLSDYDKTRYVIIWRLLLIFDLIFAMLCFVFNSSSELGFYLFLLVLLLCIGTTIFVKITHQFIVPYYVFAIGASVVITFSFIFLSNVLHYPDFLWIVNIILFSFIGLGRKWAFFFLIYHTILIFWFLGFKLNLNLAEISTISSSRLEGIIIEVICALSAIFYLFNIYVKFKEYYERELTIKNKKLQLKNEQIAQKNSENEVLIKEVHHRVKNNLQIVISMLRMQMNEIKSEETGHHFNEAISRIMTISLIHQKLYEQNNLSEVDFEKYFIQLVQEIKKLHASDVEINVSIDKRLDSIGLNSIVPLGLILNELITNSIKHKNSSQGAPIIRIDFRADNQNNILLSYSDSGSWKEDASTENKGNLGMELIAVLTEQMEGSFEREGTHYLFSVKNLAN